MSEPRTTSESHSITAGTAFTVEVAFDDQPPTLVKFADDTVNGEQLIRAVGVRPVDEYLIYEQLSSGRLEDIGLSELVQLEPGTAKRFLLFNSAASYRFVADQERREWGAARITGRKIKELIPADPDAHLLWMALRDRPDEQVLDDALIDLSQPGLERFYTTPKPEQVEIIVNTIPKLVPFGKLSLAELAALAFDPVPTGPYICLTAAYRNGPPQNPEGFFEDDGVVCVAEGMVFNVSATDKS